MADAHISNYDVRQQELSE